MVANVLQTNWRTTEVLDWTALECGDCGIAFYVPERFYRERRNNKRTWYCPNGHPRVFRESESDRLRWQLNDERARAEYWHAEQQRTEHKRRAQKAQTTRLKNRISKGVCPCCSRSFANVARHMATQHPDFATSEKSE